MSDSRRLRLGTRGSPLARWQADWVAGQLRSRGVDVQLVHITTQGDVKSAPLGEIGGQGLFTKEIQRSLLADAVDLAVHSLKDLPTEEVPGLSLAAVPRRESTRDVLIGRVASRIDDLPPRARVGTGSLRRRSQLLHYRPDLELLEIRGNVDTRLRKLDDGEYDAIVLAEAGLRRLGLEDRISQIIPPEIMLSAVGQGALGLETRVDDESSRREVATLDDPDTHAAVLAERALLATLRGGCLAPVGAWARMENAALLLEAVVLSADGQNRVATSIRGPANDAIQLGRHAAEDLLGQGAAELIRQSRAR